MSARSAFPLGAAVTLEQLELDPHPVLTRLREREPVSWLPALGGWLTTSHPVALRVMRDPAGFTVDDPRFTTAQVVGESMLSLDGERHARHRAAFTAPFRPAQVRDRFAGALTTELQQLLIELEPHGAAELRRRFAGPLAASIVTRALGLERAEVGSVLGWYDAIVAAVTALSAGEPLPDSGRAAFEALSDRLTTAIAAERAAGTEASLLAAAAHSALTRDQLIANAAVLLFGGIETTEGMIANAVLMVLERPELIPQLVEDAKLLAAAIEESLRLEPAAAVVDRYATADIELAGAPIAAGDLVRVSISAANRDPEVFADPDRFELGRGGAGRHLSFAHGPHVCIGVHLARLEARAALRELLRRLPRLRLDPERPSRITGLVFRKPVRLDVVWDA